MRRGRGEEEVGSLADAFNLEETGVGHETSEIDAALLLRPLNQCDGK